MNVTAACSSGTSAEKSTDPSRVEDVVESSTCDIANAELFVPARIYSAGSPIAGFAINRDWLVYAPWDETYYVPIGGGEPQVIAGHESGYNPGHFIGEDLVDVSADSITRYSIPSGSSTVDTLPLKCPYRAFSADDTKLFCNNPTTFMDPKTVDFSSYDLQTGQVAAVFAGGVANAQDYFLVGPNDLFVPQWDENFDMERLFRVPISGGTEVEVPIIGDFQMDIIGVGVDGVYLLGKSTQPYEVTHNYGGIYRIPFEGGVPEQIIEASPTWASTNVTAKNGKTIVLMNRSVFLVAPGQAAMPLLTSSCDVHGIAANDTHLFLAVSSPTPSAYEILRIPL